MVVHNGFKTESPRKTRRDDLIQRARVADSIHNTLVPFGIGKNGWRCTAYDERGNLQEFTSGNVIDAEHQFVIDSSDADPHCADGSRSLNIPTDDEFSMQQQHTRPRIKRSARRRGRSMLPCDASRYTAAPYPVPVRTVDIQSVVDDDPIPKKTKLRYFHIKETAKVTAFLISRLRRMQQLAGKKIAKAWIKGICPKKQAKFPYQHNRKDNPGQEIQKPLIPGWWPDTETVCRFIEPDHIKRDERMKLCLHLLRLRPTPEQLRTWNQDKSAPHPTHRLYGWTAFLKELASVEIFDDLPKEDKRKTTARRKLMMEMYEVAAMEEDYLNNGVDKDAMFHWEEDDEDRKTPQVKRSRQASVTSDTPEGSRASSVSMSCSRSKKARCESTSDVSTGSRFKPDTDILDETATGGVQCQEQPPTGAPCDVSQISGRSGSVEVRPRQSYASHIGAHDMAATMQRSSSMSSQVMEQTIQWSMEPKNWSDPPCTSSFGSRSAGFVSQSFPEETQSRFTGRHEYDFPPFQQQTEMLQVHQVHHIQEPQFAPLPNTPVFSQADMAPVSMHSYATQHCELLHQPEYTAALPLDRYIMPNGSDPTVADYHPPMTVPPRVYHQQDFKYGLAERHMVPVYDSLPRQVEWGQQFYHHQLQG